MKLIFRSLTTTLIISLTFTGSFGQENKDFLSLSIQEAQAYALENNRTVKSSRVDISLANKKIWENLATGLPQISVDANYLHQFVVPKISLGPYLDTSLLPDGIITKQDILDAYKESPPFNLGVRDNTTIDFTLSQLVFNGQYFVGLEASKVVKEVSEKTLVKTEDQIKESVADAYYSVLVIQESIKLLKESQKALDQTYNELVKMNQLGLNEDNDVDQMNINRSKISAMITSLESQKAIAMKLLKYQLGLGFDHSLALTDSLPGFIKELNGLYSDTPEFQIQNSVDYQLVSIQENLSQLLVKLQKSKYLPTVFIATRNKPTSLLSILQSRMYSGQHLIFRFFQAECVPHR
jgi:outer membrane protein